MALSGAFTVQFKTASGTGVTFGASDKSTKLLFLMGQILLTQILVEQQT